MSRGVQMSYKTRRMPVMRCGIVIVTVAFLLAYVFSYGPFMYFLIRGAIPEILCPSLVALYTPMRWFTFNPAFSESLIGLAYNKYIEWWMVLAFRANAP